MMVNLVEFDSLYGHRRNVEGYKRAIEDFDYQLSGLLPLLKDDDLLIITADHGNDPTWHGTDHTREHVPLLAYSPSMKGSIDLGLRHSFGDIGQTILANFGPVSYTHLQVGIINNILIENNACIYAKSLISKNVKYNQKVSGIYACNHFENLKMQAKLRQL